MTEYLVGTGGWAYFKVPNKSSLNAYSEIFNFVEVNQTFYEYPELKRIERWRRVVPVDFTFSVRCHQDLTHKIGLKPIDEAYYIFNQMVAYCEVLDAPFLILETPARYLLNQEEVDRVRDFFSSLNFKGVRLTWEVRAPITSAIVNLMQDFNIIHCVDLSRGKPSFHSDVVYSRLFGKANHNIYQFTDEELVEIDKNAQSNQKVIALSYHGVRMHTDAVRFIQYKKTGEFMPVTAYTGAASVRAVLSEDAEFPSSKSELIESQGWKVVDLSVEKRVHLSELLTNIPEKTYNSINEVTKELKIK